MKEELVERLYKPFELREREGLGGMKFKYVPSDSIIDRMNKTFEGCWSTEVMFQDRQDDFVVVRVRVNVYDKDSEKQFFHDGYGSSTIMRYASGNKSGQIIDLGNAYKSAESKAIKNACTRWGVGLYLEEAPEEIDRPTAASTGGGPGPFSNSTQPTPDIIPPPFPSTEPGGRSGSPDTMPEIKNAVPDIPAVGAVPPEAGVPTVATPSRVMFEDAPKPPPSAEPTNITKETGGGRVTDVQRVAIQGLLQIKDLKFPAIAADALGRTDDLPASIESLSYQDAVTIIKYGNDIDKK